MPPLNPALATVGLLWAGDDSNGGDRVTDARIDLATRIGARLARIDGVAAVMLGGSLARGEARPDSDIDLSVYYEPAHPPSTAALTDLARELDDRHPADVVTAIGAWGPWINGGAWLQIEGQRVDWLYRDLDLVRRTMADCRAGHVACHYQPGHPHGFLTHIYMGEVHHGLSLYDANGALTALKAETDPYPPLLRRAITALFLWEADFALSTSRKPADRGDVFYTTGCLFRCIAALVQVLFALNGRYIINEKGALAVVNILAIRPDGFADTAAAVLAQPGRRTANLVASVARLEALSRQVRELSSDGRNGDQ